MWQRVTTIQDKRSFIFLSLADLHCAGHLSNEILYGYIGPEASEGLDHHPRELVLQQHHAAVDNFMVAVEIFHQKLWQVLTAGGTIKHIQHQEATITENVIHEHLIVGTNLGASV